MLIMMLGHSHPADQLQRTSRHGEPASSEPTHSDTLVEAERSLR
jgi:hypothetical protein